MTPGTPNKARQPSAAQQTQLDARERQVTAALQRCQDAAEAERRGAVALQNARVRVAVDEAEKRKTSERQVTRPDSTVTSSVSCSPRTLLPPNKKRPQDTQRPESDAPLPPAQRYLPHVI
ncbi:hypothetical protein L915_07298 [Phytophthora nicotianae]|uniref:Uncharacterized protein n=2 Tax=Phytophthora nicotianae TaxID=4792 RepID=W2QBW5_PHYN3|nr:hypothetical protein PPTG_10483 [Phytophthora nicotianae INRA-310]ETK88438.1 hypothetical protein L915_07298 [Phytophthora nicotianae]ETN10336.1 hypothetical protein PPTG_10483 [Phytophthora nicotianae INRA-310]